MSISRLQYFVSVAEHLNFTKAAEEHYIAQSAISQQISRLEDEIGVELLIRNNKTTSLTPAGESFYKDVKILLKNYNKAIEKAHSLHYGYFDELHIAYNCQYERVFLPPIIKEFNNKFSNVQIKLHSCPLNKIELELENGITDIAYIFPYELSNSGAIEAKTIFTDTIDIVMSKSHQLANKDKVNLYELEDDTIIMVTQEDMPTNFSRMKEDFRYYNYNPIRIEEVQDFDTMLLMVEAGLGISFVPSNIRHNSSVNLKFFPIDIKGRHFTHEISALYLKDSENRLIKEFIEIAIGYFNNLCRVGSESARMFCGNERGQA